MSQLPSPIAKDPVLKPAEDYYHLRRQGIGFIEQMGSRHWTDYNTHDPGITILEALCYSITDIAYRSGWNIKDILSAASANPKDPFPKQAFFTARDILTVNPWTPDDFRRLLIDLDPVRNAWVFCKSCACDLYYYAWCEKDQLILSYQKPQEQPPGLQKVEVHGLYEILLELEKDQVLGDLNDRKIDHSYSLFDDDGKPHNVVMELRFPAWELAGREEWQLFLESEDAFSEQNGAWYEVTVQQFGATATHNMLADAALGEAERDRYLRDHWQDVFYVSFSIDLHPGGERIAIENATLRIFGDETVRSETTFSTLKDLCTDASSAGFIRRYRNKVLKAVQAIKEAKEALHNHRNLDEDYCRVQCVEVDDVAVCADVEVAPDADIERVEAEITLAIEQYFNPPVPFYSLQVMMDSGLAVEEIFNGHPLDCGFLKAEDLQASGLKTVLRVSDIINQLMDIQGVRAVNNLLLTRYDADGNVVRGVADPLWTNGSFMFDANKPSASWLLFLTELHQPRLYHNMSRLLFLKDGLPLRAREDEVRITLTQLRGEADRPKIKNASKDLPVPCGTFRKTEDYFPVQYSFPLTYGIGRDTLPSHVSSQRRAQAKQLKAYLMVFEQHLGNALAQLAHTADLFSLDPTIKRTYFVREFTRAVIDGYDEITAGLDLTALEAMTETHPEFHKRRNRFLDHLMARFGEQFNEYALMLFNWQGEQVALDRLIDDKIALLKAYPSISRDRGKAFNYTQKPCMQANFPGLKKRVSLLLGYPDLSFCWMPLGTPPKPSTHYQLKDTNGEVWMEGDVTLVGPDEESAREQALHEVVIQMVQSSAYEMIEEGSQFRLRLKERTGKPLGHHPELFNSRAEAQAFMDELLGWSGNERAIVVEHLLLRPKFPGDALYPACCVGPCSTCGDEDPYSFRVTTIMPGWTAPFNMNLEMRDFADRTIRQETPSHLLNKVCWVGNDGFIENPCDKVVTDLADLLMTKGLTAQGETPTEEDACACARAILTAFSRVFKEWYSDRTLEFFHADALKTVLTSEFTTKVDRTVISCTTVFADLLWADIHAVMVSYFQQIALQGWQFERFEDAWCGWLKANAPFDWTDQRLQERVVAILAGNLVSDTPASKSVRDQLCNSAAEILSSYGMVFYTWMGDNIRAGRAFEALSPFVPDPVVIGTDLTFAPETAGLIEELLANRYDAYREVSYRLWIVVTLLSRLHNTYPAVTLHNCSEGWKENPVRLDSSALGTSPFRRTSLPTPGATDLIGPSSEPGAGPERLRTPEVAPPGEVTVRKRRKSRKPRKPKKPRK